MYQNPIYMCTSWCGKICWFLVKKYWCLQQSRNVSRDLYIFWIFLDNCAKFHHCRICVADFRDGGAKRPPHPWAAPKKPILNRVKTFAIFTRKPMCWMCCEYCEICKNSFFIGDCSLSFSKMYSMVDIWYFIVIFYYSKIRSHNRKNFATDRSKFLVFSQIRFQFFSKDFFLLLFNHFAFTEICK